MTDTKLSFVTLRPLKLFPRGIPYPPGVVARRSRRRLVIGGKMPFNVLPAPQPFTALHARLRKCPHFHPILDRVLVRADVLGERAQVLKRRRVGEAVSHALTPVE